MLTMERCFASDRELVSHLIQPNIRVFCGPVVHAGAERLRRK